MPAHNDLLADVETRSRADLKKSGARRYAADPSTQITTAVWHFRSQLKTACTVHPQLGTHTMADFYNDIRECERFVAHHAGFDVNVILGQNPFVQIPLHKIDCTMARAQALALPGKLEGLCRALGIKGKDPRGHKLVQQSCKPNSKGVFDESYQLFKDLLEYNVQDVDCLINADARLAPLTPSERIIWERTWRKNEIGIPIDMHLATAVALRRQEIEQESTVTLMELTANAVTKLSQRKRIVDWANSGNRAAGLENTQKHVVAEKLQDENLHPDVRIVLELLQAEGGSAPLKAQALLDRSVNGYYKDATRFFGARSGRGTSEGANLFNIARPSGKYDGKEGRPTIDQIIVGLKAGHQYNNVALTDCLRGCVTSPPGYMLCDNDLSNAEYRIALWMAGDTERLNLLAEGGDPYIYNAIAMGRVPPGSTKATHPHERQSYKSVTLGGNYQLGHKTYMAHQRKAGNVMDENKARSDIEGYRRANPLLVSLWYALGDAFKFAIYEPPGRIFPAGKVAFQKDTHGTVWMLLPSGRAVPHYSAHVTYGGEMAFFRAKFGMMLRQKAFGGSLLEISCFAGDTEVLTRAGFKRIDTITAFDKVWDGVRWVSQGGAVCQGNKSVKEVCGTRATSDHLTLCCEADGTQTWHAWGGLSQNKLKSATALAQSLLPAGIHATKDVGDVWTLLSNVTAAPRRKLSAVAIFATQLLQVAQSALAKSKKRNRVPGAGAISLQTTNFGLSYYLPFLELSRAAPIKTTSTIEATAGAVSGFTNFGSKTAALFSRTLRRFGGGGTPRLNWTEPTTKKDTYREICSSLRGSIKHLTEELYKNLRQSEPVYDLLDCGPLNRFTIRTRTGHFLLVHNCQSMTRDLITAAEADIENELPDVYVGLDVYDSVLAWCPENVVEERSEQIRKIMTRPRSWTSGLPLDAEGYFSDRMRK